MALTIYNTIASAATVSGTAAQGTDSRGKQELAPRTREESNGNLQDEQLATRSWEPLPPSYDPTPDLYNLIQHPDRALAATLLSGKKEQLTYPEHRNAPHNARILGRGQVVVRGGEIALWLRTAGIGFLDLDTLLFWRHFGAVRWILRFFGGLGCEMVVVDYRTAPTAPTFLGHEKLSCLEYKAKIARDYMEDPLSL